MRDNKSFQNQEQAISVKNILKNFNENLKIKTIEIESSNYCDIDKENSLGKDIIDNSEIFLKEYNSGLFVEYSDLYFLRLKQMRNNLFAIAKKKWENVEICKNVVQLEEGVNKY
jgi:hypothetical protein